MKALPNKKSTTATMKLRAEELLKMAAVQKSPAQHLRASVVTDGQRASMISVGSRGFSLASLKTG